MKNINFVVVILCCLILSKIETYGAARILAIFPVPSFSHQVVFRPITQELAKRGHEIVVITTDPAFPKGKTPANLTEVDVHYESYTEWQKGYKSNKIKGLPSDVTTQFKSLLNNYIPVFDKQLQNKEIQAIINDNNKQFDLLILEACFRPALAFSHLYKVPVILISSLGRSYNNYEVMGAATHPLLYPTIQRTKLNNLSMWDKVKELYYHYTVLKYHHDIEVKDNELVRKHFGAGIPSLSELNNNIDMMFLNVHPIFEGNVPVPPNVIHIWGVHKSPEKELPQELKSYLDASKHGVIYISFGTNVDTAMLPPEKVKIFNTVFSQLPYDVLWKWDKDEPSGISKNVKIGKWFPQSDLLKHPKVKLFITQGGLQSTDEALTAGVPLMGIPMLADQWYNVEKYVAHKIGVRIDLETLSESGLHDAITDVIEDESYRENIIKLRTLMNDQPQSALERAVWWTEYVLRHGGAKHLRSPAANMSWSEYLELELVLILLSGSAVIFSFGIIVVYSIVSNLYQNCKAKIKYD